MHVESRPGPDVSVPCQQVAAGETRSAQAGSAHAGSAHAGSAHAGSAQGDVVQADALPVGAARRTRAPVVPLLGGLAEGSDQEDRSADEVEPTDGRAARSHRTRRAIINAMRVLHAEGDLRPTAPRIAERAGVSLRTVWQQFADMEALLIESVNRDKEILRSLVNRIDPDQPLAARIESFVSQRARVLEEMTPTWRAARIHEPFSDQLRDDRKRKTDGGRAELETVFAAELAQLPQAQRDQLVDALHAISLWAFWETLRTDLRLSPARARALLLDTFAALLCHAGFSVT
ncbi:MAG TPA: TetR/AcrR family transcriptional regulator [Streptosporangiaceae bacterium]|nr:TetR/AcrR family transcriptional regulator [Streptosporangiaceae bacterium]